VVVTSEALGIGRWTTWPGLLHSNAADRMWTRNHALVASSAH